MGENDMVLATEDLQNLSPEELVDVKIELNDMQKELEEIIEELEDME